jgi:flavin reductase (DIM6/NTAB) family NADH-FMN oxidoreductase RutF
MPVSPYDPNEMRPEWMIPSGVFVVTLRSGDRVNGYAAGWVVRVSEVPVMIQVAVWERNYSFELAQDAKHFAVHILEEGQQDVARHFGQQCGRDIDKLEGFDVRSGATGVPILEDCLAHLECEVVFRQRFGDHIVLIGKAIDSAIHRDGVALIHDYADYHDTPGIPEQGACD